MATSSLISDVSKNSTSSSYTKIIGLTFSVRESSHESNEQNATIFGYKYINTALLSILGCELKQ